MAAAHRPEDRGNLQVIVVNISGNNATLQETLRTVYSLARRDSGAGRQAVIPKAKTRALPNGRNDNGEDPAEEPGLFVEPEAETEEAVEDPPRITGGKRGKPRIPKVIPDLDFNSATPTFRDYAEQKKPSDHFDWYLLVTAWMKEHKATEEIGVDHIITASKYIGSKWTVPQDVGQPFRDGRRQGLFVKGSKNGLSKITSNGIDRVKRMGASE